MKPKIIAFYLPQFYPTPENDKWWGKGFTEWTNVSKAKPLFRGHYQPKIPADLGYYDLRIPQVREYQADLAKEAGIFAFCYWHYWLGEGKRLLQMPFNEVLKTGKPNFPFCLGWANHNWEKKAWDGRISGKNNELLIRQTYPHRQDIIDHFYCVLEAFNDERYFKVEKKKPFFLIYNPADIPSINYFIDKWNELAVKNGFNGMFFVAHTRDPLNIEYFKRIGFDAVNFSPHRLPFKKKNNLLVSFRRKIIKKPNIVEYKKAIVIFKHSANDKAFVLPTIIPNWDHTPRSGPNGIVLHNSHPNHFKVHVGNVLESLRKKEEKMQTAMLKSWNEWGEGNYMEPDLRYGKAYIRTLSNALEKFHK